MESSLEKMEAPRKVHDALTLLTLLKEINQRSKENDVAFPELENTFCSKA